LGRLQERKQGDPLYKEHHLGFSGSPKIAPLGEISDITGFFKLLSDNAAKNVISGKVVF
jgi:hypothetical protein